MARNVPSGVKVVSILFYLGAAFELILAILSFVSVGFVAQVPGLETAAFLGAGFLVVIGVVLVGVAVLNFFVARGLWNAKVWARIVALVLMVLSVIGSLFSLALGAIINGIVTLLIAGLIIWYLGFNKDVKIAFR